MESLPNLYTYYSACVGFPTQEGQVQFHIPSSGIQAFLIFLYYIFTPQRLNNWTLITYFIQAIFVAGGIASGGYQDTVFKLGPGNLSSLKWTQVSSLEQEVAYSKMAVVGGKLWLVSGLSPKQGQYQLRNEVHLTLVSAKYCFESIWHLIHIL